MKAVFKLAYEEYWIADNLYNRVDFKKYNDMLVRDIPISERIHSDEDMERILAFIHEKQAKQPNYIPAYALEGQIIMGLRRGEVPPLMWSDIIGGCILISKEQITVKKGENNPKEYFEIVHHTKTWKDRKFPVTDEIQEWLDRIHAVHERIGYEGGYRRSTSQAAISLWLRNYSEIRRMWQKTTIMQGWIWMKRGLF